MIDENTYLSSNTFNFNIEKNEKFLRANGFNHLLMWCNKSLFILHSEVYLKEVDEIDSAYNQLRDLTLIELTNILKQLPNQSYLEKAVNLIIKELDNYKYEIIERFEIDAPTIEHTNNDLLNDVIKLNSSLLERLNLLVFAKLKDEELSDHEIFDEIDSDLKYEKGNSLSSFQTYCSDYVEQLVDIHVEKVDNILEYLKLFIEEQDESEDESNITFKDLVSKPEKLDDYLSVLQNFKPTIVTNKNNLINKKGNRLILIAFLEALINLDLLNFSDLGKTRELFKEYFKCKISNRHFTKYSPNKEVALEYFTSALKKV